MKAAVRRRYGPVESLAIEEVPKPSVSDDDVLIRVRAVSLNASDVEFMTGTPAYARIFGVFTPKYPILGTDVAGVVEAVGKNVTRFAVGDDVMGDLLGHNGALAEYAAVPQKTLLKKPAGLSFAQASAIPQAGLIALQGILRVGNVRAGQKVLLNGSGGGSGSFAIQLAKRAGAEVTSVDNGLKLDFMKDLGADHVIDYTRDDFAQRGERYDLILDLVAERSLFEYRRLLSPSGKYLMVGGSMKRLLQAVALGPCLSLGGRKLSVLSVNANEQLEEIVELVGSGEVNTVIEREFSLEQAGEALAHVAGGRALGKVVVSLPH